jgi:membrane fusion protein (multidrug efflux system)
VVAGQYVGKGSLLTTIVGTDVLKAEFEVPQNLVGDPRLKQACRVVVRSQRGEATAIPAKVVYVAPRVEPNTGTVRVKALLDAHDTDRLKAGMFVEVELAADEKAWTH